MMWFLVKGCVSSANDSKLTVVGEWGKNLSLPRRGKVLWMRRQTVRAVEPLSMNKLDSSYNQLTFVIEKPDWKVSAKCHVRYTRLATALYSMRFRSDELRNYHHISTPSGRFTN